jgi:hypothetical protein
MNVEDIRKSAYAKWEAEGRSEGHHERHWLEAKAEFRASGGEMPQTWSSDHGGGVSPPNRAGTGTSVDEQALEKPSNDRPAADLAVEEAVSPPAPDPVPNFDLPTSEEERRMFQNGDTDRAPADRRK